MDLERSPYGELFALTFAIGGAFHAAVVAVDAATALLHQGAFHAGSLGNSVAAGTPLQALGGLLGLAIVALIVNLSSRREPRPSSSQAGRSAPCSTFWFVHSGAKIDASGPHAPAFPGRVPGTHGARFKPPNGRQTSRHGFNW